MRYSAIGDVHGAAEPLRRLLGQLEINAEPRTFWFVGDLVNRGPDSAGVVRRVRALGHAATTVLGNHDLSLLVKALSPELQSKKVAQDLLAAPDAAELLDWLRHRPLIHHDPTIGWTLVHAGIPAEWSLAEACARAAELETALRGHDHAYVLKHLYGNTPARWDPALDGIERLRYITNALTRQRFVAADNALDMSYNKTIAKAPRGLRPWFSVPGRRSIGQRIVFGHWSALGRIAWPEHGVWCLDSGAAWGGPLTALEIGAARPSLIQSQ